MVQSICEGDDFGARRSVGRRTFLMCMPQDLVKSGGMVTRVINPKPPAPNEISAESPKSAGTASSSSTFNTTAFHPLRSLFSHSSSSGTSP